MKRDLKNGILLAATMVGGMGHAGDAYGQIPGVPAGPGPRVALPVQGKAVFGVVRRSVGFQEPRQVQVSVRGHEIILTTTSASLAQSDADCKIEAVIVAKGIIDAFPSITKVRVRFYEPSASLAYRQVLVTITDVKAYAGRLVTKEQLLSSLDVDHVNDAKAAAAAGTTASAVPTPTPVNPGTPKADPDADIAHLGAAAPVDGASAPATAAAPASTNEPSVVTQLISPGAAPPGLGGAPPSKVAPTASGALPPLPSAKLKKYSNAGLTFNYPENWRVARMPQPGCFVTFEASDGSYIAIKVSTEMDVEGYIEEDERGHRDMRPLKTPIVLKFGSTGAIKGVNRLFLRAGEGGQPWLNQYVYFGEPSRIYHIKLTTPQSHYTRSSPALESILLSMKVAK